MPQKQPLRRPLRQKPFGVDKTAKSTKPSKSNVSRLPSVIAPAVSLATRLSNGQSDVFPPGFEIPNLQEDRDMSQTTYFVLCDKRGVGHYAPLVVRYHQDGFRGVFLAEPGRVFDEVGVEVIGHVRGDVFFAAVDWARSNIVHEKHEFFLRQGGGTLAERTAAVKAYARARHALADHLAKTPVLEEQLEQAAVGLLERFGKTPIEVEGEVYDPAYVRETVYYKRRMDRLQPSKGFVPASGGS